MPRTVEGLTFRQERFCRAYVEYGSARAAALEAKYEPRWAANHGYRLLKQPRIRARISRIQAETAEQACRDTDVLLGKLEAVYARALEDHHFHAAARAVDLQAKLMARRARLEADSGDGNGADTGYAEPEQTGVTPCLKAVFP
ncbi:MAG: terminase small subunit [Rhodospirillales bacterium]|nr:terminase small subunit [Rhodospirillales bacterium]